MNEAALKQWLADTNRHLHTAESIVELHTATLQGVAEVLERHAAQIERQQQVTETLLHGLQRLDEKLEQIRLILEHRD